CGRSGLSRSDAAGSQAIEKAGAGRLGRCAPHAVVTLGCPERAIPFPRDGGRVFVVQPGVEEGFIAQKTCDGKPYLHSGAAEIAAPPVGMTNLAGAGRLGRCAPHAVVTLRLSEASKP